MQRGSLLPTPGLGEELLRPTPVSGIRAKAIDMSDSTEVAPEDLAIVTLQTQLNRARQSVQELQCELKSERVEHAYDSVRIGCFYYHAAIQAMKIYTEQWCSLHGYAVPPYPSIDPTEPFSAELAAPKIEASACATETIPSSSTAKDLAIRLIRLQKKMQKLQHELDLERSNRAADWARAEQFYWNVAILATQIYAVRWCNTYDRSVSASAEPEGAIALVWQQYIIPENNTCFWCLTAVEAPAAESRF